MIHYSILLSIYHKESPKFLLNCLESINDQSIRTDEIIIVEDGELTRELDQVLDEWQNKLTNLKIIALPKNVGLGKPLNEGLKHCSHEWVFRMDTDDICAPDRFEKQIAYIQAHPEVDIFSTTVTEFNEVPEQPTAIKSVPLTHNEIVQFAQWRSPFNHMSVAYK